MADATPALNIFAKESAASLQDKQHKTVVVKEGICFEHVKEVQEFLAYVQKEFDLQHPVKWIGVVVTRPTPGKSRTTGGRHDACFIPHDDDVKKLATLKRIQLRFRWLDDVYCNGGGDILPTWFVAKYPPDKTFA